MSISTARPAISAMGLRKTFGKQVVLDGIDLTVAEGTAFALLGPNGAGKTTTVHILSTLITADGGEALVAGHDLMRNPAGVRTAIGVTGQFSALDDLLTGEEHLRMMADLNHLGKAEGRRRTADLLERFELTAEGTPDELRRRIPGGHVRLVFADAADLELAARVLGDAARDDAALALRVPSDGSVTALRALLNRLDREAVAGETLTVHTPDLDDVFFARTGHRDKTEDKVTR
ncbi:MAG: ATP-binding cassette domain-containing protein [Actinophytocola sp.]|uniref:ATP-binding cassette domain-containing protein n=1 Tax=Actinophytocola sp. TaxID=1872138 RepID=UPI00132162AB|nr:ATP-binding cassette domain-containing protein [Actinophytocola sp.]MPZ81582.1 ATP-binding cassette domain-containing protein [Actinophytocola sp.]